jgi:hypothetical protein
VQLKAIDHFSSYWSEQQPHEKRFL